MLTEKHIFWLKDGTEEARKLWSIGPQLGVTGRGENSKIIEKFNVVEERDRR